MPAFASVSLYDGQTPDPTAHTFTPVRIDRNGVALFADKSQGIPLGFPQMTLLVRPPVKNSGSSIYKVSLKVMTPVLEVTSPSTTTGIQPAPTKAYDLMATVEFNLPERSTVAQRKDVLAYVRNMLGSAFITAAVHDLDSVYG